MQVHNDIIFKRKKKNLLQKPSQNEYLDQGPDQTLFAPMKYMCVVWL